MRINGQPKLRRSSKSTLTTAIQRPLISFYQQNCFSVTALDSNVCPVSCWAKFKRQRSERSRCCAPEIIKKTAEAPGDQPTILYNMPCISAMRYSLPPSVIPPILQLDLYLKTIFPMLPTYNRSYQLCFVSLMLWLFHSSEIEMSIQGKTNKN